jgi:hypothetical protein
MVKKGITNFTEKRLAQIVPEKTTVYVAWLSTFNDNGWGWGFEKDELDLISYISEEYDPELDNLTEDYSAHDPNIDEDLLKELILLDETFPKELKNNVVFDIDKSDVPKEHPYEDGSIWKGPYNEDNSDW